MKKIVFALMVVLIASAAWAADVTITAVPDGNVVTIKYDVDMNSAPNNVRAFALDITVDACGVIEDVNCDVNADYYIYPGKINISGGVVQDYGDCVCNQGDYPSDTLGGIGTQGVTLEMASLYVGDGNAPPEEGVLATILVGGCGDSNVAIAENAIRGGVVLEDPAVDPSVSVNGCQVSNPNCYTGCMPLGHADWTEWDNMGRPDCWCTSNNPRQCHGDADGIQEGDPKVGYFYVWSGDLTMLVAGWKQSYGGDPLVDTWICADFDHAEEGDPKVGYFRVWSGDLTILVANWKSNPSPDCP